MSNDFSRRDFLGRGSMLAVGLVAPPWLAAIAKADVIRQSKGGKVDPDNVLVVCQLSGGNDGLNTVVPWADATYRTLRPTLAIPEDQVLKLDDQMGFHPSMTAVAELFKQGKVAVIQGVGYPNPNRSHFKSMDIWQSADPVGNRLKYGWIGRAFDIRSEKNALSPVAGIGLSVEKPMALQADHASIPCFASLADIQAMVGDPDTERMLRQIQGSDATGSTKVIQQANKSALDAMTELKSKLAGFAPKQTYGPDAFGQGFKQIAQIVASSPATRVVYFSAGGFDTHSRQADSHARLLKNFSEAVGAFQAEIEALGKAKKVIVLVFSEFGRRSYENGSAGTDHGKAAPMLLIGQSVKGGFHGPKPDLQRLDDGDVTFTTDFRQVYATALDDWMGVDSGVVLGESFTRLSVL
ncbi:MAG: DUF1501 domain-containing protein [Armatimonadetes bacterium]|nr:DUF1501 domain-containing protein [Armatimonadota bacterium]